MREYLKSFFEEFEYEAADRVTLASAYERIVECTPARERLFALLSDYKRDVKAIDESRYSDIKFIAEKSGISVYTVSLLAVICFSRTLRERLERLGLSKRIVSLTLSDIKWGCAEYKRLHGVVGTDNFDRYCRFLELRIFGIGRLQFELRAYSGERYEKGGKVLNTGDAALYVHIPDCGIRLEERLCNAAYRDAKKIFGALLGTSDIPFVFEGWLLYPKTLEFVQPKSNIAKFAAKYDIIKTENCRKDRNPIIRYIFGVRSDIQAELLPEKTSLQRAYKAHLLADGRMGVGKGILFLEDSEKKEEQSN